MSNSKLSKETQEVLEKIKASPFSAELKESELEKLKSVAKAHKDRMADRIWNRKDKLVSTIVIGGPGVEVMPNTLGSWFNPKVWLAKIMISIHFFLYRNVASFSRRAWATGKIIVVPMHKSLVDLATGRTRSPQRKGQGPDQSDYNRAIINRLDDLKFQVENMQDQKYKSTLMKVLENAIKKNPNN
jgi:hypothetical protein